MLHLRHLKVRGFRGFLQGREFRFDSGLTLLFGPNAAGKSSTVNAIEWCLFGDGCIGKQTSIRERIGWEVANRNQRPADVLVELHLSDGVGDWTIRRGIAKPAGKRTLVEALEVNGQADDADDRLAALLRCTFRDFMTTVHQHQEAIRDALTREPRERDDAIDRLLGLSEYRNLHGGIQSVNPKSWLKELGRRLESLEQRVRVALSQRTSDLEAKRQEAAEAFGMMADQLSAEAALQGAREAAQLLATFTQDSGIDVRLPDVPADWSRLRDFERQTHDVIARLRSQLPAAKEESTLLARRRQIETAFQDERSLGERIESARQALAKLDSADTVAEQIRRATQELDEQRTQLKQADRQAALLRDAVEVLHANITLPMRPMREGEAPAEPRAHESPVVHGSAGASPSPAGASPSPSSERCPVCDRDAPGLLEQIQSRLAKQHGGSAERIRGLEKQLAGLRQVEREHQAGQDRLRQLETEQARLKRQVGELLPDGDLEAERQRIQRRLDELGQVVKDKQARLNTVAGKLDRVRVIREYLLLEAKKGQIMAIRQAPGFAELQTLLNRAAELVGDMERIKEAVAVTSQQAANQRLDAARQHINDYFRRLSGHATITEIQIKLSSDSRSGRNTYDLTDAEGHDLVPVLSQGDLNVLALAIFLGLASAGPGTFGFVMLDDPSQSLGSGHKQRLAELLAELARSRQVIVATMDQEFRDALLKQAAATVEYRFEPWTMDGVNVSLASGGR